jgi:Flp pilus assembly CpaE family ATPase
MQEVKSETVSVLWLKRDGTKIVSSPFRLARCLVDACGTYYKDGLMVLIKATTKEEARKKADSIMLKGDNYIVN